MQSCIGFALKSQELVGRNIEKLRMKLGLAAIDEELPSMGIAAQRGIFDRNEHVFADLVDLL